MTSAGNLSSCESGLKPRPTVDQIEALIQPFLASIAEAPAHNKSNSRLEEWRDLLGRRTEQARTVVKNVVDGRLRWDPSDEDPAFYGTISGIGTGVFGERPLRVRVI